MHDPRVVSQSPNCGGVCRVDRGDGNSSAKGTQAGKAKAYSGKMPGSGEWAAEVLVPMLSVVLTVLLGAEAGVTIMKAREAVALFSSEPGRQQWTWEGCPGRWKNLVGL